MKLTKWYDPWQKPVRVGVYPTKYFAGGGYSMWTGAKWGCERDKIDGAVNDPDYFNAAQDKKWRGLSEKQA